MSDDRLFHRRLGHSQKVNSLSDLEEIVWRTYIQAADDFGVMLFTAIELRREHDRLMKRSDQVVQRMFERVRDAGLVHTFEHQGRTYCFQRDWQEFQKVRYPFRTIHPRIPAEMLAECSLATQWLHTVWPGGGRDSKLPNWMPPKDWGPPGWPVTPTRELRSGTVPERFRNGSGPRACAGVARGIPAPVPTQAQIHAPTPQLEPAPAIRVPATSQENLPALTRRDSPNDGKAVENQDPLTSSTHGLPAVVRGGASTPGGSPDDRRLRVVRGDQASDPGAGLHLPSGAWSHHPGDDSGGTSLRAPARSSTDLVIDAPAADSASDASANDAEGSEASVCGGRRALSSTIAELRERFARDVEPVGRRPRALGVQPESHASAADRPVAERAEAATVSPNEDRLGADRARGVRGQR
jgi:hypothetical protein